MKYNKFIYLAVLIFISLGIKAQERVMTVHMNNGITHQYRFNEVDSVSFIEIAEVLPKVEGQTEMMTPAMQDLAECAQFYSLTDHYLKAKSKDIYESVFGSSVAGQYALMPLEKDKMIMLYGGGKYLVTKYGSNHAEALYDENLKPVCAFSIERNNAVYEKSVMSYTIDLTDKEGVYYLRRFARLAYSNRSSVKTIEEFIPKGRTSDVKILGANISRFNKNEQGTIIPISKSRCRVSFDFTIDTNANIDAKALKIADIDMVGNDHAVSLLRRSPEPMKVRYYGDDASIEMANAQEPKFRSGFIIGADTIVRSADHYRPLVGEPCVMLWLRGEEYEQEPTEEILNAHEESLQKYINYYISLENNELALFDGETKVASVTISDGMTVGEMCEQVTQNSAFADFMVQPLIDENTTVSSVMQFPKLNLVGNYYQGFNIKLFAHITAFDYHLDSYPVILRKAIDTSVHTFDAVMTDNGVFVGIDGNFSLLDYDIINNITISENICVSNIDVVDGKITNVFNKFAGTTRLSEPYVITPRSPFLLGLMGHKVEADAKEGDVGYPASDVSSERLSNMCKIMKEQGYKTLNMDELAEYMDSRMKGEGLYSFFMFDDFRIDDIYTNETTRNIFIENGIKTNLALVQAYLWDGYSTQAKGKYIEPMANLGWSCVSHSLRHNQPTAKKPSVYINYEIKQCRKECEKWGMNSEVFVYNWDGTWELSDIFFLKNGYKYAINSRGVGTRNSTNPYRLGRTSFQEALPFETVKKVLKW